MKLTLTQCPDLPETEVEIRYADMNTQIMSLSRQIEQSEVYLYGEEGGRQYRIPIGDILYAESVDRKTFIYTKSAVCRSELKLYQLIGKMASADFVRVSKSCVININALDNVKALFNSRMEATLINGEKITISRTYISALKAMFLTGGDKL